MLAAGLLAKRSGRARAEGKLNRDGKNLLGPRLTGRNRLSRETTGLQPFLDRLGFNIVGLRLHHLSSSGTRTFASEY